MATTTTSSFHIFFLASLMFQGLLQNGFLIKGRPVVENSDLLCSTHIVRLDSLLPKTFCESMIRDTNKGSSIDVMHKHGPCSRNKLIAPTPSQVFMKESVRVSSINHRIFVNSSKHRYWNSKIKMVMRTKYTIGLGSSNYIVTAGLGIPKSESSFIIDTTYDLTWLKCRNVRIKQLYSPKRSESYAIVNSSSPLCFQLNSTPGVWSTSSGQKLFPCQYKLCSHNRKISVGYLGLERLTLTQDNRFRNFPFGCSYERNRILGNVDGILGLGTHRTSIVSRTATAYKQVFSYCLPSISSYIGYLKFGNNNISDTVKYTPLVVQYSSFYGLNVIGVSVGGRQILPFLDIILLDTPTIIDSGTEITQLPHLVYNAMKAEFMKRMNYSMTSRHFILDTCYDLSGYESVTIPAISFHFKGGVKIDVHPSGILYMVDKSKGCLAFTKNPSTKSIMILGNMMQKTLEVVYDIGKRQIGFRHGSCN